MDYPVNYEKTLAQARKQIEVNVAIERIDEIEARWIRIITSEDYTFADIKKETLLTDIEDLLGCCIVFINKIGELEMLVQHRKPSGLLRKAKAFNRGNK